MSKEAMWGRAVVTGFECCFCSAEEFDTSACDAAAFPCPAAVDGVIRRADPGSDGRNEAPGLVDACFKATEAGPLTCALVSGAVA